MLIDDKHDLIEGKADYSCNLLRCQLFIKITITYLLINDVRWLIVLIFLSHELDARQGNAQITSEDAIFHVALET